MIKFKLNEDHVVIIQSDKIYLDGLLCISKDASGLVLFVHRSGSSRFSVRNQNDEVIIQLNDEAMKRLNCIKKNGYNYRMQLTYLKNQGHWMRWRALPKIGSLIT